jgi:hypothetical protein
MKKIIVLIISALPILAFASTNGSVRACYYDHQAQYKLADTLKIEPKDAAKHIDEVVTVEGKVASFKVFSSTVLLNIGGEYPNQLLTVVLKGDAIALYKDGTKPTITATGKLVLRNGKPEMVVSDKNAIKLIE